MKTIKNVALYGASIFGIVVGASVTSACAIWSGIHTIRYLEKKFPLD